MNQAMETRVAALEKLLKDKGVLADDNVEVYRQQTSERHGANRSSSAFC
jgi:hypothetical protein